MLLLQENKKNIKKILQFQENVVTLHPQNKTERSKAP